MQAVPHSSEIPAYGQPGKVLIIACGMLAREILAVRELNRLDRLELRCLPADLHFHPDKIPSAMDEAIARARTEGYENIFVGYADCGTGGMLDRICAKHGVERLAGPHCFATYQGLDAFEEIAEADFTSFYMTDFLCRQFDAFFMRPLGLDRHPELAQDYFGHYEKLVYLAQTDDAALEKVARDAADMLRLAFEIRRTGYGGLVPALKEAADTKRPASSINGSP